MMPIGPSDRRHAELYEPHGRGGRDGGAARALLAEGALNEEERVVTRTAQFVLTYVQ